MARFALRVLLYAIGTSFVWWLTSEQMSAATIWLAKAAHRLVGAPAPYLLLEIYDYFWLAPPVQLFVGLTLASSWRGWRMRVQCLLLGVALLWFLVVMTVVVMSSPYLGPTQARMVIGLILTKSHLLLTPVLFWLILIGPPPASLLRGEPTDESRRRDDGKVQTRLRPWRSVAAVLATCVLVPLSVAIIECSAPSEVRVARRSLMRALESGDLRQSRSAAGELGKVQQAHYRTQAERGGYEVEKDPRIYYLVGRLSQAMGDLRGAERFLLHECMPHPARAILRRELRSSGGSSTATAP